MGGRRRQGWAFFGYTVAVLGTVFLVSAQEDKVEVGVFEGPVSVTSPEGTIRRLKSGEALMESLSEPSVNYELTPQLYNELESDVDLVAHRQVLSVAHVTPPGEEVKAAPERPKIDSAPVVEVDKTPESMSIRELRETALEAQHGGENRRATGFLEQALTRMSADDPAGADILLELAQLHLNRLGEDREAVRYLELFIERWPEDPTANTIRAQLCQLRKAPPCPR